MDIEPSLPPLIITADALLVLARTRDERRAELWGLVLSSLALPSQIARTENGYVISVHAMDFELAEKALAEYELENRPEPVLPEPIPVAARSQAALGLAVLLCAIYYVSGARGHGPGSGSASTSPWFEHGAAVSELVLHGQLYRIVTALTLHADLAHLAGNVFACVIFVTALFREMGPGLGAMLCLTTGALGNFLNALLHRHGHSSIGFSTAIFGVVGILAALSYMQRRRRKRPAWIALAAGLAILGMLGADKESDTMAHLFGFFSGVALGSISSSLPDRLRTPGTQAVLTAVALAIVVGCWLLAGARHFAA